MYYVTVPCRLLLLSSLWHMIPQLLTQVEDNIRASYGTEKDRIRSGFRGRVNWSLRCEYVNTDKSQDAVGKYSELQRHRRRGPRL